MTADLAATTLLGPTFERLDLQELGSEPGGTVPELGSKPGGTVPELGSKPGATLPELGSKDRNFAYLWGPLRP